ncbi:MAG TPA: histidinol dehydrogenase [Trueperaceae bacterium]
MRLVEGTRAALEWCEGRLRGRWGAASRGAVAAAVADVLERVRAGGEAAVLELTERFDGVARERVLVDAAELEAGAARVPAGLRRAIDEAMARVEAYYRAQPTGGFEVVDGDSRLGALTVPLDAVGCYVPGGTAPLFSSLYMTAVPARVAGVRTLVAATPPRPDGSVPDEVAYVALALGMTAVAAVGGAQAVAALSFGAGVPRVDKVVGPGNAYVTEAKRQLFGFVGVESLAGPTETLVLADGSADPRHAAADLVAQAEHAGAEPVLVTTSERLWREAPRLAEELAAALPTAPAALESLRERGVSVLVEDLAGGVAVLNAFAPEHACLLLDDPWPVAREVRHAGGLFVGHRSMEALGDYLAGPSHVMPTGATARFLSFVSVRDFQRVLPYVQAGPELLARVGRHAASLARAEGLEGHARAVESRLEEE